MRNGQYFTTLFSEPEAGASFHNAHILRNITQDNNIENLEQPITEQEIRTSIHNLNINKAGGPDGLCIEMFKATLDTTLPYLHSLFNDGGRTGLVVRASDSGSGDPGSILGGVGVLFP